MEFFTTPNSKNIIAILRIVTIEKSELTFFLTLYFHDLMNIIKNLEFRKANMFQKKLKSDIEKITNNNKIFVSAGKSRNTYMLQQEE